MVWKHMGLHTMIDSRTNSISEPAMKIMLHTERQLRGGRWCALFGSNDNMKRVLYFLVFLLFAETFQGCTLLVQPALTDAAMSKSPVTFSDPVLNQRRILLCGDISERVAEDTIEKLFYLD